MEKAVERVEALFQKADSDVNCLSQRLKFEFEKNEDLEKINPAELLRNLGDIKKEYASVVRQVEAIQESQKEALSEFRGHLNDVCKVLLALQSNTGSVPTEKPEELVRLEQFLGSDIPWGGEAAPSDRGQGAGDMCSGTTTHQITPEKNEDLHNSSDSCESCSPESVTSPAHRRTSNEFKEVSNQEFESVSTLVRGQVKLTDVNRTYIILWNHFRKNRDCKSLTPNEMHKLGLRVSGQTGQAKLKVLRALKLLKLSNKGDVLDVC